MAWTEYRSGDVIPGTSYVVLAKLGEGGHGCVYEVRHRYLKKKRLVLKMLHSDLADRDDLIARMDAEMHMLAAVDHPNIVSVSDGGVTGEVPARPFFVMERLVGETLRTLIDAAGAKTVGIRSALSMAIEVLDALDTLHTIHGIVHRDIKPDNIFLHRTAVDTSVTKLLDFGIAQAAGAIRRTGARVAIGTPKYMAPEQLRGEPATAAVDLYAVGLLLFEMLTGRGPFDDAPASIGLAHLQRVPPLLRFFVPTAPAELEDLVARCLEKEPSRRPRTARMLASDLRQIKATLDIAHGITSGRAASTDETLIENRQIASRAVVPFEPPRSSELPLPPIGEADTDPTMPPLPIHGRAPEPSSAARIAPTLVSEVDRGVRPSPRDSRALVRDAAPLVDSVFAPSPLDEGLPSTKPRPAAGIPALPQRSTTGAVASEPARSAGAQIGAGALVVAMLALGAATVAIRTREPERSAARAVRTGEDLAVRERAVALVATEAPAPQAVSAPVPRAPVIRAAPLPRIAASTPPPVETAPAAPAPTVTSKIDRDYRLNE